MKRLAIFLFCFLLLISFTTTSFAQLSGNYTIGSGGNYTTIQNAADDLLKSGNYFYTIKAGSFNQVKKMILLR